MAASNAEKADRIAEYARKHGVSLKDSLAFGDSVADLPMLESVSIYFSSTVKNLYFLLWPRR